MKINIISSFLAAWVIALGACVPIVPPHVASEKVVGTKQIKGVVTERIIEKRLKTIWFTPINPDAKLFPYTLQNGYYFRDTNDYAISAHALTGKYPYIRFFPVPNSHLWICIAQDILKDGDHLITSVVVLNKNRTINQFTVARGFRYKGSWGIDYDPNTSPLLYIYKESGTVKYDPIANAYVN